MGPLKGLPVPWVTLDPLIFPLKEATSADLNFKRLGKYNCVIFFFFAPKFHFFPTTRLCGSPHLETNDLFCKDKYEVSHMILRFKFIYLFLAALGLHCCARAFSSCDEQGLLFVMVHGFPIAVASLVAEHGL